MPKYANQKHITVHKEICDRQHIYAAINIDAMKLAAQTLKPGAFKLWIYFAKNQNFYSFDLSQKAVQEEFGMKKDMYDNAVKELINTGYLTSSAGTSSVGGPEF